MKSLHIAKKTISVLLALVMMTGCLTHMSVRAQTDEVVESGALTVLNHGGTNLLYVTTEYASQTDTRPAANLSLQAVESDGLISVVQNGVVNTDTGAYLIHENGMYLLVFMYTNITFSAGDHVIIQGKFCMTYDDGTSYIVDMRKTTFECMDPTATGTSCWKLDTEYTQTEATDIYSGATKYANAEHGWHFYLQLSEKSDDIASDSSLSGLEYSIDGGERKSLTAFYAGYQNGSLFFIMPELSETITENITLTIYAGVATTSDKYYGFEFASDIVLYGNQHGWSMEGFIIQTAYTDTAIGGIDSSATQYKNAEQGWHFYLDLTENSSDIASDSALAGFEYTLNDGERKALTAFYAGHHEGSLFFIMPELPELITENTKLTIFSGQAITSDKYYGLTLSADVQLYGNRYGWSLDGYLVPEDTGVLGDVNGDSEANVSDLIYLKKYLEGTVTISTQAEITKNDYVVNEDDTDGLRQILVTSYNSNNRPLGIPTYEDNREIEMAAYMGPRKAGKDYYVNGVSQGTHTVDFINDFEFKRYKDAGFTYLIAEQDAAYGSDNLSTYMELAKNNDLEVVLLDNKMTDFLRATEVPTDTSDIAVRTAEMKEQYGDTFKGWMLADEPTIAYLNNYKVVANAIRQVDTTSFLMTAFLPFHASKVNFTTDETILNKIANSETLTDAEKHVAYMEYANSYGNVMGEFNYDLYPLLAGTTVRSDWLRNLSLVAQGGKENHYLTGITLQSHEYKKLDDEGNETVIYRAPTEEDDIGYQAYTALAYGMRKLNYYTYWGHYRQSSNGYMTQTMVQYPEGDGTQSVTTPIYEAVQAVNTEIKAYDHVLMNYAWEGTITLGNANDYSESEYTNERLVAYSATEDTSVVIGCMKDAVGYDGYMIANANNPANDMATTVTVQFEQATRAVVYIDGKQTIVNLENGSYEVTIPSGEGVFVIPIV